MEENNWETVFVQIYIIFENNDTIIVSKANIKAYYNYFGDITL